MNGFILQREPGPRIAPPRFERGPAEPNRHAAFQRIEDRQFLAMERAFFAHGGSASGDEIVRRLRLRADQPLSTLARWIVDRKVVHFEWQGSTLIPVFQFDLTDMSLRAPVARVLVELNTVFDDWDVALWFAQPNSWLRDMAPVDVLASHPLEVVHAARADRFVARG